MRVMVAEDEPLVLAHVVDLLTQAGCEVVAEHRDGESALRWLQEHPGAIDAMFLDIRMPKLSGLEVAAWPEGNGIPIVFVTGWGDHALQAFDVAAVDFLVKPVALDRVKRAVARLMEVSGMPRADQATPIHIRAGSSRDGVLGLDSVDAFEVEDREVYAWAGGRRHLALWFRTLKGVEKEFPGQPFKRVGRNRLERVTQA